jgi:HEAT repeat protein
MLIQDPDEAVRWKALRFLAKAAKNQLSIAVPHLDSQTVAALLAWLLHSGDTQINMQEIITRLSDPDSLTRRFAAAAAARLGPHNPVLLEHAAASTDSEVSSFANEELEALRR